MAVNGGLTRGAGCMAREGYGLRSTRALGAGPSNGGYFSVAVMLRQDLDEHGVRCLTPAACKRIWQIEVAEALCLPGDGAADEPSALQRNPQRRSGTSAG